MTWKAHRAFFLSGQENRSLLFVLNYYSDKQAAYNTLYTALVTLSKLLAPAMPFMAEEIYQNLVRSVSPNSPESVHLSEWPTAHEYLINENGFTRAFRQAEGKS